MFVLISSEVGERPCHINYKTIPLLLWMLHSCGKRVCEEILWDFYD